MAEEATVTAPLEANLSSRLKGKNVSNVCEFGREYPVKALDERVVSSIDL